MCPCPFRPFPLSPPPGVCHVKVSLALAGAVSVIHEASLTADDDAGEHAIPPVTGTAAEAEAHDGCEHAR